MTREEALEKIKKLLALANRPGTPAEGENALAKAMNLAEIHSITIRRKEDPMHRYLYEAQQRKINAEMKRRATTYQKAYMAGGLAYFHGQPITDCPYRKKVLSVDLPLAWKTGWRTAWETDIAEKRAASGL